MIEFKDPDHLAKVVKFAVEHGCTDKLMGQLDYLATYGGGSNVCEVFNDFAPNSFEFLMKRPDGTRWFNGGLIYSGPEQPLDGTAPALTVGIGVDSTKHGWSVHT
jgi:hypothetical protein